MTERQFFLSMLKFFFQREVYNFHRAHGRPIRFADCRPLWAAMKIKTNAYIARMKSGQMMIAGKDA